MALHKQQVLNAVRIVRIVFSIIPRTFQQQNYQRMIPFDQLSISPLCLQH